MSDDRKPETLFPLIMRDTLEAAGELVIESAPEGSILLNFGVPLARIWLTPLEARQLVHCLINRLETIPDEEIFGRPVQVTSGED